MKWVKVLDEEWKALHFFNLEVVKELKKIVAQ